MVVILLIGCSTASRLPADLSIQSKLFLAFRIDSIAYVDLRPDTSSGKMDLPAIAARQREWKISPTLTPALRAELSSMIKSSSNPEGLPTILTVTLDEGYYMVSGNAGQVGEHALFNCSMLFDVKGSTTDFKTFARPTMIMWASSTPRRKKPESCIASPSATVFILCLRMRRRYSTNQVRQIFILSPATECRRTGPGRWYPAASRQIQRSTSFS